jgi:hypothetical protein
MRSEPDNDIVKPIGFDLDQINIYKRCAVINRQLDHSKLNTSIKPYNTSRFGLKFCEVVKKIMCRRFLTIYEKKRVKVFEIADDYVKDTLDVFGYLDLVTDVNNMKSAIFNNAQKSCFNFHRKPHFLLKNIMEEKDIQGFYNKIYNRGENPSHEQKKVVEYFAFNFYNGTINKIDNSLLNQLDNNTLSYLLHRLNNIVEIVRAGMQPEFDRTLIHIEGEGF